MAYDHIAIETESRKKWEELGLYSTDVTDKSTDPYYLLVEFPYPSGDLHIGHWYAFAVTDIYARLLRLRGKNVLFPIGFDAFGLPAENAAIKNNVDPKEWTYKNMDRMRAQISSMGASFDWTKEVVTCDPNYYHWTQWLFIKLVEQGLAERREASVKWCPKDQTVLANEQVQDGHCERCGTQVEEKRLTQWFLKITDYADRLLSGLEKLPWREEIKEAQRAWIGKSEGAKLKFNLTHIFQGSTLEDVGAVEVFTTRPDTVFGATYIVLAPEHPLVANLLQHGSQSSLAEYVEETKRKTDRERSENKQKTGVKLEGVLAVNPATKEEIPIYTADYVIGSYGTGAVMAVPAHDDRDLQFALKFNLNIKPVIADVDSSDQIFPAMTEARIKSARESGLATIGPGILFNSGQFDGRNSEEAKWDIVKAVGGERATQYRLRDWLVSRQRYWGCPIPIVYDSEGKPHPIPAEHLPWLLPTDVDFTPTGKAPLASSVELKERVVKIFGDGWTPEYDTLDTFVDSSWYFLRYLDCKNAQQFSDVALLKTWLPVHRYSGGSEHTTMHLLYARFFTMALYDLALVPVEEPFFERFNRGLILGPDGQKMSKSKGNVINPDEFVKKYGADAVRVYLAFIGPYNEPGSYPWSLDGVSAMRKFLDRIYRLADRINLGVKPPSEMPGSLQQALAKAVKKVAGDGDRFKFNTSVAALMILVNEMETHKNIPALAFSQMLIMLSPFAPHLSEHLWEKLGGEGSVHQALWPSYEQSDEDEKEVIVQVNGKRRGSLLLAVDTPQTEAVLLAREIPTVVAALGTSKPRRVVYVPGKILNLVV